MAEYKTFICDAYNCKKPEARHFHFEVDTQIDPPSGRTESVHGHADLCFDHLAMRFQSLIETLDPDVQRAVWKDILKK